MAGYATWEGAGISLARVKNGKVVIEPFIEGRVAAMKESQKHPIGIIIKHGYDTGGRGGSHITDLHVYYKGKNAEVLPAKDLDHPYIRVLESALSNISDELEEGISDMKYEKPDVDQYSFRKKKTTKKPKRKVVKKCRCK
jgi:hypothetical protein